MELKLVAEYRDACPTDTTSKASVLQLKKDDIVARRMNQQIKDDEENGDSERMITGTTPTTPTILLSIWVARGRKSLEINCSSLWQFARFFDF